MLNFDPKLQNMRHCDFVIYKKLNDARRIYIYGRGRGKSLLFEDYVNKVVHRKKTERDPRRDFDTFMRLFREYGKLKSWKEIYPEPLYKLHNDFELELTEPLWTKENPWLLPSLKRTNLD